MKHVLFAFVSTALLATPVLACPNHDEAAPAQKTADQTKKPATATSTTPEKAAPAPKTDDSKTTKPADKVSSR
jgi:hypothetical protein